MIILHRVQCLILMNARKAQTLQLHEMVVWTPDGMRGEVIVKDGSGVKIRWEDGQFGYYQFTDLLSQNRKVTVSESTKDQNSRTW